MAGPLSIITTTVTNTITIQATATHGVATPHATFTTVAGLPAVTATPMHVFVVNSSFGSGWNDPLVTVTIGLVVATVVLAMVTGFSVYIAWKSWKDTQDSSQNMLTVALNSAESARLSAQSANEIASAAAQLVNTSSSSAEAALQSATTASFSFEMQRRIWVEQQETERPFISLTTGKTGRKSKSHSSEPDRYVVEVALDNFGIRPASELHGKLYVSDRVNGQDNWILINELQEANDIPLHSGVKWYGEVNTPSSSVPYIAVVEICYKDKVTQREIPDRFIKILERDETTPARQQQGISHSDVERIRFSFNEWLSEQSFQ